MKKKIQSLQKILSLFIITWLLSCNCYCQCLSHQQFWDSTLNIENSADNNKLDELIKLKKQFEYCSLQKDSVYARMLHRIGAFYYPANIDNAIKFTLQALQINTQKNAGASKAFAVNNYYNLGFYYLYQLKYNEALLYFDSSITAANNLAGKENLVVLARLYRGNIFFKKGNYEKDIEETSLGLPVARKINDSSLFVALLLERAQSYIIQEKFSDATKNLNAAMFLLRYVKKYDSWANALRYTAEIEKKTNAREAFELFKHCIEYRKQVDLFQTAIDYNDAGELLMNTNRNYSLAKKYFDSAISLGLKINNYRACALAMNNLAEMSFFKSDYSTALKQNNQAYQFLFTHYKLPNSLINPPYKEFLSIDTKTLAQFILSDKTQFLLYQYNQLKNPEILKAAIATAFLNDSLITDLRHEQTGDQSKLYWRNFTRDFFSYAIDACYLDNNADAAFYFMEKSRAVLLNDKLNELGADAHLPAKETLQLEQMQDEVSAEQQKLNLLSDSSQQYQQQLNKLLRAKDNFDHFIKMIEQKNPVYYQYKYADEVPSLTQLQSYLKKNNQSFVHYFMNDSATYILAITSSSSKLIKLTQKDLNKIQLAEFLQFCSNKQALMNRYDSFAVLSNSIYKKIFQPLQLSSGRIIICADNIVIPFDALCTDMNGKNFLLKDYAFSYVYSARSLIKPFTNATATGNFIGFAPVSFANYLGVQPLLNAADALKASANSYPTEKLFTHKNATRNNFFKYSSSYSVVSVFSHARADTSGNEPILFMQDSVIHLSELQSLKHPAIQLVLLSACQTNVGKAATGEGIYSLARGFATAGIPSIAATLWKADEQTIYSVSEKFNQYLAKGMSKDEALQKAKSDFIQSNQGNEKLLPYYWANMIVIGNTDAIKLQTAKPYNYLWFIVAGIIISATIFLLATRNKTLNRIP